MKKISISIPNPCHENWEIMTPQDQGRFCSSCQKTVIDFSNMSDRQIVDFLKKPSGSLCGRFHSDQLNRQLQVPKKRIPWVKYFFQITWPAFVLFLKSCGQKHELVGEPQVKDVRERNEQQYDPIVGFVLTEITPVDTLQETKPSKLVCSQDATTMGLQTMPPRQVIGDTILTELPVVEEIAPKEYNPMDTVTVNSLSTSQMGRLVSGGIAVSISSTENHVSEEKVAPAIERKIHAYPNPVRCGMQLTIGADFGDDVPKQIHLFSSGGGLITISQFNWTKGRKVTLMIPSSLSAGTYFVRITTEKQQAQTAKIIIVN